MTTPIDEEVRRATKLLEAVILASGRTRKDVDERLGVGSGLPVSRPR